MLTRDDLQSIQQVTKKVIDDSLNDALEGFAANTINPAFQAVQDQFQSVQDQINGIQGQVNGVQGQVNGLHTQINELHTEIQKRPTIAHIDLKLENMENRLKEDLGEKPLARDRVLNAKTDMVAHKLGDKSVFTLDDVHEIERISPVAVSPLG